MNTLDDIIKKYNQFKKNKIVMMTFTLDPIQIGKRRAKRQWILTHDLLEEILGRYADHGLLVAELTQKAVVHYHALLSLHKDYYDILIVDHMKDVKYFGNTYLNQHVVSDLESFNRAYNYLHKDIDKTKNIIKDEVYVELLCRPQLDHKTRFRDIVLGHSTEELDNII